MFTTVSAQPLLNIAKQIGLGYTAGDTQGGSGCSFVDFNKDGFDDLTIGTEEGDSILFFKNNGNGTFSKLPSLVNHTGLSRQISWVDIDNDNDLDLYVNTGITSGPAQNRLYERTPAGLIDITTTSGLAIVNDNSYGASFADIDSDGDLDMYVSVLFGGTDILYRNNGNRTFTNINISSGIGNDTLPDFCALFLDYDLDGDADLYTINDKYAVANKMWRNNGNSTFTDVTTQTGTAFPIDAMNGALGDHDNDGFFDIFMTNTSAGNALLRDNGNHEYFDIAQSIGLALPGQVFWGANFFDADNDKDLDIYIASENGNSGDRNYFMKNNYDGFFSDFEEFSPNGLAGDTLNSYAMANGDYNNDGKIDVAVVNANNDSIAFWKNNIVNANKYVKLKLEGTISNKNAIGSLIKVYDGPDAQHRYTTCGGTFLAQNSFIEHLGMGSSNDIDSIIVRWPRGMISKYYNLGMNQTFLLKEGGCLNHDYNFNNTAANKYIGTNDNLFLASNWSKGHIPTLKEDVEIVNSLPTPKSYNIPNGNVFNCQSIILKGNITFLNFGTLNVERANGAALTVDIGANFNNRSILNIKKSCGEALKLIGSFEQKGILNISKN